MLKRDAACKREITGTLRIELTQERNMLEVFRHQK